MSTDLYGIRVLEVAPAEKRARLRVFVVYYDVAYKSHQPLPNDLSFFLRILWDKADTRFGGGGPLGDEVSVDDICDEGYVDRNARRFVERAVGLEARNYPVKDWSGFKDFYYENNGKWVDEEKLVQADYDVFVTDPKYLAHLRKGLSWGTTSYETKALPLPAAGAGAPAPKKAPAKAPAKKSAPKKRAKAAPKKRGKPARAKPKKAASKVRRSRK